MRFRAVVLFFAAMAGASWCRAQNSVPEFRPAYFGTNEIRFEPFVSIDWQSIARANFHSFDIERPDLTQLRDKWSEVSASSQFEYTAPLPSTLVQHVYVLTEAGVFDLAPNRLIGTISYVLASQNAKPTGPPTFEGVVSAVSKESSASDAGFAVSFRNPVKFEISPVPVSSSASDPGIFESKNGNQATYMYRDASGLLGKLEQEPMETPGVQKAYLLKFSGIPSSYLFVRWVPDASNCQYKYSLYKVSDRITKVVDNFYGCDA